MSPTPRCSALSVALSNGTQPWTDIPGARRLNKSLFLLNCFSLVSVTMMREELIQGGWHQCCAHQLICWVPSLFLRSPTIFLCGSSELPVNFYLLPQFSNHRQDGEKFPPWIWNVGGDRDRRFHKLVRGLQHCSNELASFITAHWFCRLLIVRLVPVSNLGSIFLIKKLLM